MKNYLSKEFFDLIKPFIRKMKLTCLFLLVFSLSLLATNVNSQGLKVSMNMTNTSIAEVISSIERQTEYLFVYDKNKVNLARKVNVNANNQSVAEVLTNLFSNTDVVYAMEGNNIMLMSRSVSEVQQQQKTVTGKITDSSGDPLPGVSVVIEGTIHGTITDNNGKYTIKVNSNEAVLVFSFIGMQTTKVPIGNKHLINVTLSSSTEDLDEVTVVAFGKQKKTDMVASISTIKTKDLLQSDGNITTALAGRLPGMISFQTSGEPGKDDANYFVRGITSFGASIYPLVVVDQVEMQREDLGKLSPDDIESFSILKDASATALYGTKGANGVILITTKVGKPGKVKISARLENTTLVPTQIPKFIGGVQYMEMYNETMMSQYPDKTKEELDLFSDLKIQNTKAGGNKYLYPNVDWYKEMFKDFANNQLVNVNMSGGGSIASYYVSANFNHQEGMLKKIALYDNFDTGINIKRSNVRSNITINLTPTTKVAINFSGTFEKNQGPYNSASTIFSQIVNVNPVIFPMYYEADANNIGLKDKRVFFGNANNGSGTGASYNNPYATMVSAVKDEFNTTMIGTFRIDQKLNKITDGLTAAAVASFRTTTSNMGWRGFTPYYYTIGGVYSDGSYALEDPPLQNGVDYLNRGGTSKSSQYFTYFEGSLNYNKTFGSHGVHGLLLTKCNETGVSGSDAFTSLPQRNIGVIGRLSYNYDHRYMSEFNFGYYGSEKFTKAHRFGFFPSIGGAWNISNENFFSSIKRVADQVKLRVSYGLVGNDNVSSNRFVYLSHISTNVGNSYFFGSNSDVYNGAYVSQYANPNLTWEIAKKLNFGFDATFFHDFTLNVDFYTNNQTGIYMNRTTIPVSSGLPTQGGNVGSAFSKGIDIGWKYNKFFNKNFWMQSYGTFTLAKGHITNIEDLNYPEKYKKKEGRPINQMWGYIADRLFLDDEEAANSPVQQVGGSGTYGAGDIKYRDVNGDNVVDGNDIVPIGFPSSPEINYGFGISMGYKNFDISCFFQGLANRSFFINAGYSGMGVIPFVDKRNMLKVIADDHWSNENQNSNAFWPKLSIDKNSNNAVKSTKWLRDGSFIRMKNMEMGYTIPKNITERIHISKARFYLRGSNLFMVYSKFKLWDVEQGGNGMGYPLQRTFNLGANITL